MKAAIAVIASAIALNLSSIAHANVSVEHDDVTVVAEQDMPEMSAKGNFPAGYCTWYADSMIRKHWGSAFNKGTSWQGNAKDWLANAAKKGLKTSSKPSKYAIGVFGATKNNEFGHVVFVTDVNDKKKTFTFTEMNYAGLGKTTTRTLSIAKSGAIGFIARPSK